MIQKNLKVLYIGGNGNISWWCVNKSLQLGHEVYIITRSPFKKTRRTLDSKVKIINVNDINNTTEIKTIYFILLNIYSSFKIITYS